MSKSVFKSILKLFSEYSFYAQKGKGDASTVLAKKNLDLQSFLKSFHSFDVFTYALVDVSDLKIIKVGDTFKQITGYEPALFEGKGFHTILKLHKIQDIFKSIKGGNQYFKYLYALPKKNRPFVKANRTLDLIKANGTKIHVLVQGIPVLFNEKMEVILFLLICTDISAIKTDHKFTHFIIDASDENEIKKIYIDHSELENNNEKVPSSAEIKILVNLSHGLSSKMIADKLFISEHTVKTHRKNMLKKFQCASSSELIRKAITKGWI
ncbi:LuxR C-terminal-related transcriptional regulator [Cecembia rubra]|uniref:PAS domain-containing protein n=1 Tax=Cecembia rubra TaxID=1485585 RepID=A0A2P8E2W5_9BACT|nr:LuxR C-terminal-related transcriptional regulator [Cecembia rubra]PSL03815.1 PAS domain-containing protein [Cecembia rubra]